MFEHGDVVSPQDTKISPEDFFTYLLVMFHRIEELQSTLHKKYEDEDHPLREAMDFMDDFIFKYYDPTRWFG